jgi:hypothetical protein
VLALNSPKYLEMAQGHISLSGRTIEERPNDPCASGCLCWRWSGSGRVGGGSYHEMAWGGMRGGPCPSIYSHGGGLGGGMRGLVGG